MRKNRRKGRSLAELLDSTALGILLRRRKEGTFGEILYGYADGKSEGSGKAD